MSEAPLLCYTGSKQEAPAKWQNTACGIRFKKKKKKCPFLGAAIPYDIQSYLAFLFKRKEKLSMKVACLGYFVRSLVKKKMMILRFWLAEWRLGLLRVLHHSRRERKYCFLIYRNCRNIPWSCNHEEEMEFLAHLSPAASVLFQPWGFGDASGE